MSSINSISSSNSWYLQNTSQVSNSNSQNTKVHNHHKDRNSYENDINFNQSNQNIATTNPLDSLVANGTLTEDQETAIQDAFRSSIQSNAAGTYGKNQTNPITTLVNNGVITEDQASSIKDAFKSAAQPPKPPEGQGQLSLDDDLGTLVSDGTITEDQLTAVKNAIENSVEKNNNSTSGESTDPLASLVTNGTITDDQETSIKDALQAAKEKYKAYSYGAAAPSEN